jgi:hypothetical protein
MLENYRQKPLSTPQFPLLMPFLHRVPHRLHYVEE